jgi:hypothetical protein
MDAFYDNLLPKRLEKLLKPFGATVERGSVNTGRLPAIGGKGPMQLTEPAWIARLTPEQKKAIQEKGFPLLLAILAAEQAQGEQ